MTNPKDIDRQIAEVELELAILTARIVSTEDTIAFYQKQVEKYPAYQRQVDEQKMVRENLLSERLPFISRLRELNAQYTGWTRAFLVVNSNGHIHKNRSCSTCYVTTQYYWLTELSGDDEMTIVEKAGEKACTVCYADAPSEYLTRKTQLEHPDVVRARAEREAKRAEREAKKLKNGIWNPDGTPLKVREHTWLHTIETERTAWIEAVDCLQWGAYTQNEERKAELNLKLEIILTALAHKNGITVEEALATAKAKLAKRK